MAKRVWDEFDAEAEKQGQAIRTQHQNIGRPRIDRAVGGRHTSRTRNRKCVVATAFRMQVASELGVIR